MTRCTLVFLLLSFPALADTLPGLATPYALPDRSLTPGTVDAALSLADICTKNTKAHRRVSKATRLQVLATYGISNPQSLDMELDHLVPLSIGGSNTAANLWPQMAPGFRVKDRLERELGRQACAAYETLTEESSNAIWRQMQKDVAEDWVAAYAKYVRPR